MESPMSTRDTTPISNFIEKTSGKSIFCTEARIFSIFVDRTNNTTAHSTSQQLNIPTLSRCGKLNCTKPKMLQPILSVNDLHSIPTHPVPESSNLSIPNHLLDEQNLRFNRSTHPRILCPMFQDLRESTERVVRDSLRNMEIKLQRTALLDLFVHRLKPSTEYCVELLKPKPANAQLQLMPASQSVLQVQTGNSLVEANRYLNGFDFSDRRQVLKLCVCSKEHSLAIQEYINSS